MTKKTAQLCRMGGLLSFNVGIGYAAKSSTKSVISLMRGLLRE